MTPAMTPAQNFARPSVLHSTIHSEFLPCNADNMADQNTVKEAEVSMANLQLDSVTGEMVSKSELKKRLKLREREAKKKEKEAAAPPKAQKKVSAEEEEANLSPNVSDRIQQHSFLPIQRLYYPSSHHAQHPCDTQANKIHPSRLAIL